MERPQGGTAYATVHQHPCRLEGKHEKTQVQRRLQGHESRVSKEEIHQDLECLLGIFPTPAKRKSPCSRHGSPLSKNESDSEIPIISGETISDDPHDRRHRNPRPARNLRESLRGLCRDRHHYSRARAVTRKDGLAIDFSPKTERGSQRLSTQSIRRVHSFLSY